MKNIISVAFLLLFTALTSCEVKPEAINYGIDPCHFCKMTIVDQQHAAQYVTKKGKQFKFDAVECMLNQLSEDGTENLELLFVSDYSHPGAMTDATAAIYLISPEIKSPMGANLSSFSSDQKALETQSSHGGDIYNWEEILRKYQVSQ